MYTGALTFVNRAGTGNGGSLTFSDNSQAGNASVTFADNSEAGNGGTPDLCEQLGGFAEGHNNQEFGKLAYGRVSKGNDIYITNAANSADNGYFTISDLTATVITLDKSGVSLLTQSDSAARFGLYDAITRNDGGDWTGRRIHARRADHVCKSASQASNVGTFTILNITSTVITIDQSGALTSGTDTSCEIRSSRHDHPDNRQLER